MILDLHRQGASVSVIARRTGFDRKTVRKVIASGLEPPIYGPRPPRVTRLQPFEPYLRGRLAAVPELTGRRLHRELGALGYRGGYTAVTDLLREIRPAVSPPFELCFETPPGQQAQVDFAQVQTEFTDEPGVVRIVWLFSLVLGHSRMLWGRFLRNGAPFAELPEAFKRLQGSLLRRPGGDREMAEILALVLQHDEQAVLCAVELALEAGLPTKTHILNLLHRLVDGKTAAAAVNAPQALVLSREPQANVERYDALRGGPDEREAHHAA